MWEGRLRVLTELMACGRVACEITPGLPWAAGSDDLLSLKLENARWWLSFWRKDDEFNCGRVLWVYWEHLDLRDGLQLDTNHIMAFTLVLYLSKACKNKKNQSFVGVYIVLVFFAFIKAVYKSTGILVALLCKKNTQSPRWNSPKSDYKWRIMDLGEAKESRWPSFEQVTPVLKKKSALTSHCHPSGDRLLGPEQTPSANSLPRVCKNPCSSTSRTAPGTLGAYGPEIKVGCKSGILGRGYLCHLAYSPERQQPEPRQLHTALTIFSSFLS